MVSSFYYISQLRILVKWASLLGHKADAARYAAVLAPLPAAFNALFFARMLNARGVREFNTIKYTRYVLKYVYYLYVNH